MEQIWSKAKKRRWLWGIGGTAFSAIGFICLALFEQYNSVLSEFRADLKHFNETSSEYVKKESFQRFREHFRESMKELHEGELTRVRLEQELRASEKAREELTLELRQMREHLAFLDGRQTSSPIVSGAPHKIEPHAN
jgi:DNA repair exonuclease SbcCD ATPase subunit